MVNAGAEDDLRASLAEALLNGVDEVIKGVVEVVLMTLPVLIINAF